MWNLLGSNKLCVERELHREHYQHQVKLVNIKSRVDTRAPRPMSHLGSKARKVQLEQDKNESIRKDNQLLLRKMIAIDMKPSTVSPLPMRRTPSTGSLNRHARIQELTKISQENKSILRRLQRTESVYSVKRWREQNDYNAYLRNHLSQNAGRVPRTWNYDMDSFEQFASVRSYSRPLTAQFYSKRDLLEAKRPKTTGVRGRSTGLRRSS